MKSWFLFIHPKSNHGRQFGIYLSMGWWGEGAVSLLAETFPVINEQVMLFFPDFFLKRGKLFYHGLKILWPSISMFRKSLDAPFYLFRKLDNIGRINYLFFKSFILGLFSIT